MTAKKPQPTHPDSPVIQLKRAMRHGKPVWVKNGRKLSQRMLAVTSANGKATSLVEPGRGPLTITMYDTALTSSAYGYGAPQLGDLFNDVMGAVVPGWDARPDWMKKIQLKADPVKFLDAAKKFVPPSQVGKILGFGQQYGVTPYYAGMEVTPGAGQYGYEYGGVAARIQAMPGWVWLAGGGVILLVVMMGTRRR
jgi:hypothetical protein